MNATLSHRLRSANLLISTIAIGRHSSRQCDPTPILCAHSVIMRSKSAGDCAAQFLMRRAVPTTTPQSPEMGAIGPHALPSPLRLDRQSKAKQMRSERLAIHMMIAQGVLFAAETAT